MKKPRSKIRHWVNEDGAALLKQKFFTKNDSRVKVKLAYLSGERWGAPAEAVKIPL